MLALTAGVGGGQGLTLLGVEYFGLWYFTCWTLSVGRTGLG